VEASDRERVVALIGTPNPESSRLVALTLTEGDPTWAGALAGVRLGLPVFHITEDCVRAQVPPEVYEAEVGLAADVLDACAIAHALDEVRDRQANG
jgi:betaine reductase